MHRQPVGDGLTALEYLAPLIFRVAISNNHNLELTNEKVTLRYRASESGNLRTFPS